MIVVVVGTGTDVGKTHVTCALLRAAVDAGLAARGWKPLASGARGPFGDDALAHAEAARAAPIAPGHVFEPPVSPHLAARAAGVDVSIPALVDRARALAGSLDLLLVETAGGLFSPVTDAHANDELVRALAPTAVLLVAPDRLGVLHDVAATRLAGRARQVEVSATVLSAPPAPDASTGTNAAELASSAGVDVVAVFPRAAPVRPTSLAAAQATLAALGVSLIHTIPNI
ncbi:MAG: dethiobiotin synthase [Polyangiaceae bacterium]|nr:dethiobiotin synthase [Polyangiaceae bacterium]